MTVNLGHYQKSNFSSAPRHNHREERYYDVFNNQKQLFGGRNEDHYFINMQRENPERPPATNLTTLRKTLQQSQLLHGEVSTKVGSLEQRDYTIRRPTLKVGKDSYVDTYSPF